MGWIRRAAIALSFCLVAVLNTSPAKAQTWNNFTSVAVNWSTGGNWIGGVAPASTAATILTFGSTPSQLPPTSLFQPSGSYTANVDAASPFIVNQLIFTGGASSDVNANGITISNSAVAGGISFQGASPKITQSGTGSIAFANGTATSDLVLTASGLTINGAGIGHVSLLGVIGGSGTLTIDHLGTTPMLSGGQVFLTPATANTFTGSVVLNKGNLTIGTVTPFGNAANAMVVNGGSLRGTAGAATIANALTLNSQLVYDGAFGATFSGVVSGNGGIRLAHSVPSTVNFQNAINGTGAINLEGQGFSNPTFLLSSTATLTGHARFASSYTASFGAFSIDNTTANSNNRLNSAAVMNLFNGELQIIGSTTANSIESVATLNLIGGNRLVLTPSINRGISFTATTLNRVNNGTFVVEVPTTASATLGLPVGTAANGNVLFSNLNASSNVNGVLPFGYAITGINSTGALVRYDVARGVVPLVAADYSSSHPYIANNLPTANLLISAPFGAVDGTISANAIMLSTASGSAYGSGLYGTGTLNLTSGVIGTGLTGGPVNPNAVPSLIGTQIALGAVTGNILAQTNTIITGKISGTGGLVKSGPAYLLLTGDNSNLRGGITLNGGALFFDADNNLGAPKANITLNIEQDSGFLTYLPTNQFRTATSTNLAVNRPLTIGSAGGGGLSVALSATTLNWTGNIGGDGRLFKSGAGILQLSGVNKFAGDLVINTGTVIANHDAALGSASSGIVIGNGAIFQPGASFATTRNFLLAGQFNPNIIYTASQDFIIYGNLGVSQIGNQFTKSGLGDLALVANNSVNGPIVVGDPTAVHRHGSPFAQPGGSLTLAGPNGALAQGTSYTFNMGTLVHLDNNTRKFNTAPDPSPLPTSDVAAININQNRIGSRQVTLAGAEFRLTGNANGSVFEHIGASNTAGLTIGSLGNTITLVQPNSFTDQATTLVATSYNPSATSGIAFFRGTNLGAAAGDRTSMVFVTAPTLINNLLPQAYFADSATAAPQDFATIVANSVQRFTGYVALPASGTSAATTYSHTGAVSMTAAANANALKLNNGTINLGANNMTLGGATQSGLLLSVGADSIGTTAVTVPDLAFGTQSARLAVNDTLAIGSVSNPVRITTSNGLHKFGPGTLSISSSNVTGGGYQVSQGTLRFLTSAAYTSLQPVTILPGATLDTNNLGTVTVPFGVFSLAGFGTVNLGSGAIGTGAAAAAFGGSLVGNGALVHRNNNGQTLSGNSPGFSGDVYVTGGSATNAANGLIIDANVIPTHPTTPGPLGTSTVAIQLGATSGLTNANLTFGPNVTRFERDINVRAGSSGFVVLTGLNGNVTTITSNIALNRTLRLALGSFSLATGSYTFTGNISGPGTLQVYGGQVALWGNNTYTGGTFLEVDATGHAPLGIGSDTALGTGPARFGFNFNNTMALRADNGSRTLANNFTIDSVNPSIAIGFVGTNSLTINGSINLNTTNTNGLIRLFNVETTGNAVVSLNNQIFSSNGTAGVNKVGGGTLVLGGLNTFALGLTLTEGVLGFGSNSIGAITTSGPVGTGPLTINGGTLRAVDDVRTITNTVSVGGDFAVDGNNALILSGAMNLGNAPRTMVVTNTTTTNFEGVISSSAGSGLVKQGGGLLVLSNDNTYTGNTLVAGGRLLVNNIGLGSGTSSGQVTVNSLAKLGGTGRIAGGITVNNGGTLAPGASIGTLTSTNNTSAAAVLQSGAHFEIELNHPNTAIAPAPGVSHDYFFNASPNSVMTLGSTLNFVLVGNAGNAVPYVKDVPVSYTVATFNNTTIGAGINAPGTTYTFNTTNFVPVGAANVTGYIYSAVIIGNNLVLTITPVPEPGVVLSICAAAFGAGALFRRRARSKRAV